MHTTPIPLVEYWQGDQNAQSWLCSLKCGNREMQTTYTKGSAHRVWRRTARACWIGTTSRLSHPSFW